MFWKTDTNGLIISENSNGTKGRKNKFNMKKKHLKKIDSIY